jgi:hypothetical protein
LAFPGIPKGIKLTPLNALRELELSTLIVWVLPSVLRTITSVSLGCIRFFLLVHQLEYVVDVSIRRYWSQLDFELCALASRLEAASRYCRGGLQVKFVDLNPATPTPIVEETARLFLPRSQEHRYISFSVG